VRQSWDQGSLLKLIDVIGRTGRNWPIRDGKDQIKLITSSVKSAGKPADDSSSEDSLARSRGNSQNVTRDPHASLSLFAPREKETIDSQPAIVPPRASAKPPPRDYNDLFVGTDEDESPASPSKSAGGRTPSPSKPTVIAPKVGAGKNFAPSRIFDIDGNESHSPSADKTPSTERHYRPHPAKFQHFDFTDEGESQDAPKPKPLVEVKKSRHGSQWSFDDFQTPEKVIPSKVLRNNDVRHWSNSEDEAVDSPVRQKQIPKPRKDAETHFELQDDGTPEGGPRLVGRPRGAGQNNGLGLYKNNLYDENSGLPGGDEPRHINTIANVKDRSKDFEPHFTMTDDSPAAKPAQERLPEDRAKAVKMMDANWSAYDESPSQRENMPASRARSDVGTGKGPLSESTNTMSNRNDNPKGIMIGGDGMGGKKGAGRQWGFGDDSDGEEVGGRNQPGKYRTGKTQGRTQTTGDDFWDF